VVDAKSAYRVVYFEYVDNAPRSECGKREPGERNQRARPVNRFGKHAARFSQKGCSASRLFRTLGEAALSQRAQQHLLSYLTLEVDYTFRRLRFTQLDPETFRASIFCNDRPH
jgi:hypothetical protein